MTSTKDAPPQAAVRQADPRLVATQQGMLGYGTEFWRKVKGGELGSIPVVLGLAIIFAIFGGMDSRFLNPGYLSTITVDIVATGMLATGVVFVLLLGEIDLSIGSVSGACAAVLAVANHRWGFNEWESILLAVLVGLCMGLLHGFFFAKIGVPAFIVTLAGLLGWLGFMLWVLGKTGSYNFPNTNGIIDSLTNTYFAQVIAAYGLAALVTAGYLLVCLMGRRRRVRAGVPARTPAAIAVRTVLMAIVLFGIAFVFNQSRGLPLAPVIFLVFVVGLGFVLRNTAYGRKVFAVGGNVEAARRAGINVTAIRISVFAISGTMAAIGGIFFASINENITKSGTGQQILMEAIAAAVIGGTSLFGGRGSTYAALLGVLVIQSIKAGMNLVGITDYAQYMVTGIVLLAAVVIDSVSRRSQRASGRA